MVIQAISTLFYVMMAKMRVMMVMLVMRDIGANVGFSTPGLAGSKDMFLIHEHTERGKSLREKEWLRRRFWLETLYLWMHFLNYYFFKAVRASSGRWKEQNFFFHRLGGRALNAEPCLRADHCLEKPAFLTPWQCSSLLKFLGFLINFLKLLLFF